MAFAMIASKHSTEQLIHGFDRGLIRFKIEFIVFKLAFLGFSLYGLYEFTSRLRKK